MPYFSELVDPKDPAFRNAVETPNLPPSLYTAESIARDPSRRVWFYAGAVQAKGPIPADAVRVYGTVPIVADASGSPVTLAPATVDMPASAVAARWSDGQGPPTADTPGRPGDYYLDAVSGDVFKGG